MDLCVQKGFDGIEPDNIDGYSNNSGFNLSYQDQINYNKFLAQAAHERGLSVGLKNDVEQVNDLVDFFDYVTAEECYQYNECDGYSPFISQNKAVFQTEYGTSLDDFCPESLSLGFSGILKNLNLGAYMEACITGSTSQASTTSFQTSEDTSEVDTTNNEELSQLVEENKKLREDLERQGEQIDDLNEQIDYLSEFIASIQGFFGNLFG